ncbi:MAG: hypothetical protein M3N32_06890 [Actinomycetota bacterium]|nr:hypothetical protein [Actinomycetota bacterium]
MWRGSIHSRGGFDRDTAEHGRNASAMHLLDSLLAVLAPVRCLACGNRARPPWCPPCSRAVARLRVEMGCPRCGGTSGLHPCWSRDVPIAKTVAAFQYAGPVAAAVVAAKARGAWAAWESLGLCLAQTVLTAPVLEVDVVTWIPADRRRIRERGFDHAACLAAPVAARLGVSLRRLLVARSGRADQAELSLPARMALSDDAFAPAGPVEGRRILLVDDVLTTGATARAAARALVRGGARTVQLAVLARAGNHALGARGTPPHPRAPRLRQVHPDGPSLAAYHGGDPTNSDNPNHVITR